MITPPRMSGIHDELIRLWFTPATNEYWNNKKYGCDIHDGIHVVAEKVGIVHPVWFDSFLLHPYLYWP